MYNTGLILEQVQIRNPFDFRRGVIRRARTPSNVEIITIILRFQIQIFKILKKYSECYYWIYIHSKVLYRSKLADREVYYNTNCRRTRPTNWVSGWHYKLSSNCNIVPKTIETVKNPPGAVAFSIDREFVYIHTVWRYYRQSYYIITIDNTNNNIIYHEIIQMRAIKDKYWWHLRIHNIILCKGYDEQLQLRLGRRTQGSGVFRTPSQISRKILDINCPAYTYNSYVSRFFFLQKSLPRKSLFLGSALHSGIHTRTDRYFFLKKRTCYYIVIYFHRSGPRGQFSGFTFLKYVIFFFIFKTPTILVLLRPEWDAFFFF